jgi:hypothetical protein
MKILLDECVTRHLKVLLSEHEVYTVREMNWSGIKNGKLLSLCVANSFEIFLTIDKNLRFQQNIVKHPIIVVVLNSVTSNLSELKEFIPVLKVKIPAFEKNKVYTIDKS